MEAYYIYGKNAVLEAINAGVEFEKIYMLYGMPKEYSSKIYSAAKRRKIAIVSFDRNKFLALERRAVPKGVKSQGIIAAVSIVKTIELSELIVRSYNDYSEPFIVALDGINDPQNLGAIARTALCAGAAGLILPERDSAPLSPATIKASAGAIEHLAIAKVGNLANALAILKENKFWIFGTDSSANTDYTSQIYDCPAVIIVGSEGKGMRDIIKKSCDFLIRIPMLGKFDSLNASVAAAVILFEIVRQRRINQ